MKNQNLKAGFWLIFLLLAPFCSLAENTACGFLSFEQRKEISIQDFSRLADHKVISDDSGSVSIYYFDDEDRPHKTGLHAAGLVFARMGDLGETPVGGYIWASNTIGRVIFEREQSSDDVLTVMATPSSDDSRCVIKSLVITLKSNGQFLIDGQLIGVVK